jgi:hypothetical protein
MSISIEYRVADEKVLDTIRELWMALNRYDIGKSVRFRPTMKE